MRRIDIKNSLLFLNYKFLKLKIDYKFIIKFALLYCTLNVNKTPTRSREIVFMIILWHGCDGYETEIVKIWA